MNRRKFLVMAGSAAGATTLGFPFIVKSAAAQEVTVRLALIAAAGQPIELGSQRFKEIVESKTGGQIKVQIFPGGQLGGEIQLQDSVSTGIIQMANVGTPVTSGKLKKLDILNMYYLWRDREHMDKVLQGEIGKALFSEYQSKTGISVLAANWQQGTRQTVTKREVKNPGDFKGTKIRVTAGVPIYDQLWKAMGTNPVPLGFTEAYSAMQTGVVDAIELPPDFIWNNGFHKLGTHLIMTSHYIYSNIMIANTAFFSKLSEANRNILTEAAVEAGKHQTSLLLSQEKDLITKLTTDNLISVTPDMGAFSKSVLPVFESNMNTWGRDLYDRIMAA